MNKLSSTKKIKATKALACTPIISHLSFTVLAERRHKLECTIVKKITANNCKILISNITILGQNVAISGLISGKWHEIAKLEDNLHSIAKKNNATIQLKRNNSPFDTAPNQEYFNYMLQATVNNQTSTLSELLHFFNCENITVTYVKFNTSVYNQNVAHLEIHVQIPINMPIMHLRENFLILCEKLNLDTNLEPAIN